MQTSGSELTQPDRALATSLSCAQWTLAGARRRLARPLDQDCAAVEKRLTEAEAALGRLEEVLRALVLSGGRTAFLESMVNGLESRVAGLRARKARVQVRLARRRASLRQGSWLDMTPAALRRGEAADA